MTVDYDDLRAKALAHLSNFDNGTHWDGCDATHWQCCMRALLDELDARYRLGFEAAREAAAKWHIGFVRSCELTDRIEAAGWHTRAADGIRAIPLPGGEK